MDVKSRALARRNLERRLAVFAGALPRPDKGWIRATRDALGMTSRQLAARMGVAQPSVAEFERNEANDTITLASLRKAAEAMGCTLVYALAPNEPFENLMRRQAQQVADARLARVHHTMSLENQATSADDLSDQRERLIDELMRGDPRRLWDPT